jgi:AsmA family
MDLLNRETMSKPAAIEATIGESRITAQATSFTDLRALKAKVEIDAEQKLAEILASMGIAKADLPPFEATATVEPGEGGSLITADLTLEGASAHVDGKVDDLAAPLDGFEAKLAIDAPELGPILASYEVPHADQMPSANLNADVAHDGSRTSVAMEGTVGGDSIELQGSYEGAITAFLNPRVGLSLEGAALGGLPAQLGFAKRPIESYRIAAQVEERSGETSPVKLDVTIEKTRVRFDGSIDQLRTFKGVDGRTRLQGPDPAAVLDLFKLPAISLPPYDVAGQVTWHGDDIKVTAFDGKVGDSDARGEIAIDLSAEPPAVVADLQSDRLDFDDLAGLIGAPPATGKGETASPAQERTAERREKQERLLPEAKIDPKAWQNLNLNLRYSAELIESENLPIDRIKLHVISKDGWLTVDPLEMGLADGSILVFVSLDGTQVPVAVEFDGRIKALQLQDMLAKLEVSGEGLGEFNGRIRLEGSGTSVDQVLGSASGQTVLTMTGGGLDALIVEAIGLDIAESLVVLLDSLAQSEEDKVPIRCAIVNLQLDQGIATARPVVIDTTDSKFILDGTINLRDETLDLFLQSYPKDVSPLSFNQPLHVDGPLLSPSVNPAPGKTENEVLGWLLAPVDALLPFFDVGGEEDSPCGRLLAQAKEAAKKRPTEPVD